MISVVVTIGTLTGAGRAPVRAALRENLANPRLQAVHVLSEGAADWLVEEFGARLTLHPVAARPTFADVLAFANGLLAQGAGTVAVMNADISIATPGDAARILEAFALLEDAATAPAVLALTRHDSTAAGPAITLYEASGLPNTLSADAWVFRHPVTVRTDLFYAMGQMNCDMFLAHDLIRAGYRLFNPCLDITLTHHEAEKPLAFYDGKLQEASVQDLMHRHAALNHVHPWNYFGTPWLRLDWLRQGYRPGPASTNLKRLIVALPAGREHLLADRLDRLAALSAAHDLEIQVVCDGDLDLAVRLTAGRLAGLPRLSLNAPQGSLAELRRALLAGRQYGFATMAFVTGLSRLTPALLAEAPAVWVALEPEETAEEAGADPERGCSLITSVFRSDVFIRGFIANITALQGYDRLTDHIFLVSALSETELGALSDLLDRKPNVLVVWNRSDPGLYPCWNLGLRLARRRYVSNANVDDLRDPAQLVTLLRDLEMRPEVLVAATAMNPFETYPADGSLPAGRAGWYADQAGPFGFFDIGRLDGSDPPTLQPHNMPHCMPVWRRSLHGRYGWFDEATFGTFADWAFWLKVLRDGDSGWMNGAALSFYFVNPTSHNRRGTGQDVFHARVEQDFLGAFLDRRHGRPVHAARPLPAVAPKLNLTGRDQEFGRHRNDFTRLIRALEPLHRGDGTGCRMVPFLERYFVWGNSPGEAASDDPQPITEDWIGILHVPFDAPDWFQRSVSPESFLDTPLWRASRRACRGIITLSADLERDLRVRDPDLPTLAVLHPTELDVRMFDLDAWRRAPRVVQVGDWLRKLQAIHRLRVPNMQRIILHKAFTEAFTRHEIAVFGDHRDPAVEIRHLVPDAEYDDLLSSSVVLCLMYATAANNVVVECLARATPLLVNPLPAVVEYLGPDYPLYVADEDAAARMLARPDRIRAAHEHLLDRRTRIDLTYQGFCRDIAASEFYARL